MKWILLALALCVSTFPSYAQTPPNTYIGVYLDDTHTSWCVTQAPPYTVEIWFWALPGIEGLLGAVFDIEYHGVELVGDRVYHPNILILPKKCSPPCPSFSRGYIDCQSDWVWLFHETIMVATTEPTTIEVQPFLAQFSDVIAYNCDDVDQPAIVLSTVYLNTCGPLPVENTTWGSIKSLYN